MGDDQVNEYVYKFVSAGNCQSLPGPRAGARSTRARCTSRGSTTTAPDEWLPLVHGDGPLTAANGFADQGDVLVKTRLAASARRRDPDGPSRVDGRSTRTPGSSTSP